MKLANKNEIVLVDDNEIDSNFIRRCHEMSSLDNQLICFSSGYDFLNHMKLVKSGAKEIPAVVLLDINMPGVNGFEVVKELRNYPEFQSKPPIILFTNSDSPHEIERAKSMDLEFCEKFLTREETIKFLESLA